MSAPSAPVTERQVQEDLARLDAYRNQLNQLLQQHQYLSASRGDHERAKSTLEGLDRVPAASELLIPVGGETYLRGAPAASTKVLIGIGAGFVVELERPQVTELLAQRVGKIDQATRELEGQMQTLEERIQLLSRRLDALARATSGAPVAGDVGSN
ncbi:MAG TPA: prefoldin subunit alpha [Thermoplasmata archaeon]|nr:prefoldin subunit alpha [Thermoplasmata archaeon]